MSENKIDLNSVNIDGDNNNISNTINKYVIVLSSSPEEIQLTLDVKVKIVLRFLYEGFKDSAGQKMIGWHFNEKMAEFLQFPYEELFNIKKELFAEKLIKNETNLSVVLTTLGEDVARWIYKNRPQEYDMEREDILKNAIEHAKKHKDMSFLISIKSSFTSKIIEELENNGYLTQCSRGGQMQDKYIDGRYQRLLTPYFCDVFKNELSHSY